MFFMYFIVDLGSDCGDRMMGFGKVRKGQEGEAGSIQEEEAWRSKREEAVSGQQNPSLK